MLKIIDKVVIPAHFHNVTHDKMKTKLVKNTTGAHVNHS